ncbi:MAG: DUF1836 domain-containing protein [Oscillospiraceae bacterium]|nr:DUF1836 domain-containing protein [Oscillospiraceae bacterium]
MNYDKALVAGKLRRWETYLNNYRLPAWEQIPDLGLYMEQVIVLLRQYLDYLPPELKEEEAITAAAINNYVRTKIMPEPVKKRYYRAHIAYLLVICTLKQGLSIALISKILPPGLPEPELRELYTRYAARHALSAAFFVEQVRGVAGPILDHSDENAFSIRRTEELIVSSAIIGGFSRLLAEKLMLLADKDLSTGGSIEKLPEAEALLWNGKNNT